MHSTRGCRIVIDRMARRIPDEPAVGEFPIAARRWSSRLRLPLRGSVRNGTKYREATGTVRSTDTMEGMIPTLEWLPEGVNFLDQTKLPFEETYVLATDYKQVATVIKDMIVRGAMAIGVSAAMGVALGIDRSTATTSAGLNAEVDVICKTLAETRPTAVNLFWGIAQIRDLYTELAAKGTPIPEIKKAVVALAQPALRRGHRQPAQAGSFRRGAAAARGHRPDALQRRSAGRLRIRVGAGGDSCGGGERARRSTCSPTRRAPSTRARA